MDYLVRVSNFLCECCLVFYFCFICADFSFASGGIAVVYEAFLIYFSFIFSAILIIKKLKSKYKIKSIFIFSCCFLSYYFVAKKVPFSKYETLILLFFFLNILFLFLYIFSQIKKQNKNI